MNKNIDNLLEKIVGEKVDECPTCTYDAFWCYPRGDYKPAMIGDVLEKMDGEFVDRATEEKVRECFIVWRRCGLSRPLQEIIEEDTKNGRKLLAFLTDIFL